MVGSTTSETSTSFYPVIATGIILYIESDHLPRAFNIHPRSELLVDGYILMFL